mmetsp:Transcript_4937/g.12811  ORF Transcript_4937/g.12811 Transcript_4937/m.12811 type:complete len:204 (+) Transcript_4937:2357-2968(+)
MVYARLLFELAGALEEVECVQVVAHITGRKKELPVVSPAFACGLIHLGVFDNLILAVLDADDADRFGWRSLEARLVPHVGSRLRHRAHEDRVGDLHQRIVDTIDVHKLNSALYHVVEDTSLADGAVEAAVTVRSSRKSRFRLEDHLTLGREARDDVLLKDKNIIRVETEVIIVFQKSDCVGFGRPGGHDIPRDSTLASSLCLP